MTTNAHRQLADKLAVEILEATNQQAGLVIVLLAHDREDGVIEIDAAIRSGCALTLKGAETMVAFGERCRDYITKAATDLATETDGEVVDRADVRAEFEAGQRGSS